MVLTAKSNVHVIRVTHDGVILKQGNVIVSQAGKVLAVIKVGST